MKCRHVGPPSAIRLLVVLWVVAGLGCTTDSSEAPPPPGSGDIRLDPGTRFQVMSGWEANAQSGEELPIFPSYRDQLLDLAVSDLGLTRVRLEVWSGMENTRDLWRENQDGSLSDAAYRCMRYATVNDNADPSTMAPGGFQFSGLDYRIENVVLPLKQRVEARGDHLFLNLTYVAFIQQITGLGCPAGLTYDHTSPAEYAEFMLAAVQHMWAKYNLVPDAIEFLLEPEYNSVWTGTMIGQGILASAARLTAAGFDIKFIGPSTTSMANAVPYFDEVAGVPGAVAHLLELSYHRYKGVSDENLMAIAARASQAGVNTSMLEHLGSGYEDLHRDLKLGQVSSWQQFALAFPGGDDGSKYYVVTSTGPATATVAMGDRTRYLRQYFRWIRPEARRIEAVSREASLDPLAFIGPDSSYVVIVKASKAMNITVEGLPAGTYGVTFTTSDQTGASQPEASVATGKLLSTSIPSAGVLTIFHR